MIFVFKYNNSPYVEFLTYGIVIGKKSNGKLKNKCM